MKIFNTLSRGKEEFVPLTPGEAKMYACGPTVYNFVHVGDVGPMIIFDTVRRYFEYKGYDVRYVSSFTDVDDRIVKKVVEEGVDVDTVPHRYVERCKKGTTAMNARPATVHPQATQEVCGMLEMIQTLIDKNYAYVTRGGTAYSKTDSFKEYGGLSHKNLDELQSGFREIKATDEEGKEDPNDLVLWKPKEEGEPFWESSWCDRRPDWHIECSVMSRRYPGEQIDIHADGEDLIFPYHENEIAQNECANDKNFATYQTHNGFLNIDNKKMSESLGNSLTVREISERYSLQVLRFFVFNTHYHSPPNFNTSLTEASEGDLECILTCVEKLRDLEAKASVSPRTTGERGNMEEADKLRGRYEEAMGDSFNTADAISAISELVKLANATVDESSTREFVSYMKTTMEELCNVLGIITEKKEEVLNSEIKEMIETR